MALQDDQTGKAGQPLGGGSGGTPPPPPPPPAQDLSGIMEENVDISALVANAGNQSQQQQFLSSVKIPPHPHTKFNEQEFIQLLAGSISLTINEKKKIIEAVPQLSQFQIDELMKIFREEKDKFTALEQKHAEEIKKLESQHAGSWQDLEAKSEEEQKKRDEQAKADALRKQLGL